MAASRTALLAKLDDAYTVYFDRETLPGEASPALSAVYAFHSSNECYVLSKKAKLWSAETHEYVYVFSVSDLTADVYAAARDLACRLGRERIRPHIDHMSSNITAVILCDAMTADAAASLSKTRIRKNFMLSFYGWMEFRAVAVVPSTGQVVTNRAGKDLAEFIRGNLEKCSSNEEEMH